MTESFGEEETKLNNLTYSNIFFLSRMYLFRSVLHQLTKRQYFFKMYDVKIILIELMVIIKKQ